MGLLSCRIRKIATWDRQGEELSEAGHQATEARRVWEQLQLSRRAEFLLEASLKERASELKACRFLPISLFLVLLSLASAVLVISIKAGVCKWCSNFAVALLLISLLAAFFFCWQKAGDLLCGVRRQLAS